MGKKGKKFILIELLIAVIIIVILAVIALPNYVSYRNKSKISVAVSTMGTVRNALESFASNCFGHPFPADSAIIDWPTLAKICNDNGASLKTAEGEAGIAFVSYDRKDSNGDGEDDTYELIVEVPAIPNDMYGKRLVVTPHGVFKQSA
jgi:type II secretory pathway pseudopilin PulG